MNGRRLVLLSLACAVLTLAGCAKPIPPPPAAWLPFDLASTRVGDVTVRYQKSVEPQLPQIRRELAALLDEQAAWLAHLNELSGRRDEMTADINRLVAANPTPDQSKVQQAAVGVMLAVNSVLKRFHLGENTDIYILNGAWSKDFMRNGGSIPHCHYDAATDKAEYRLNFEVNDKSPTSRMEIVLATDLPDTPPAERLGSLSGLAEILQSLWKSLPTTGVAIHEVTEMTLITTRLRCSTPHRRWFTEGCAEAVTTELLKKYGTAHEQEVYAAGNNPADYADIRDQVNLQYWVRSDCTIDAPTDFEKRLEHARYSFARLEVQRLVDEHGIEVLARIIEQAPPPDSKDPFDPVKAIKAATGEDITPRLLAYQTFSTTEEGIAKYTAEADAAIARSDAAAALGPFLRRTELRPLDDVRDYAGVATILFELGYEKESDEVLLKFARFFDANNEPKAAFMFRERFALHASLSGDPIRAADTAELVLAEKPNFVPALTVRMLKLMQDGQRAQAAAVAQRIIRLSPDPNTPWRRKAEQVLASVRGGSLMGP